MKQSISHWGMHEIEKPALVAAPGCIPLHNGLSYSSYSYDAQYLHQSTALDPKQSQAAAQKFY